MSVSNSLQPAPRLASSPAPLKAPKRREPERPRTRLKFRVVGFKPQPDPYRPTSSRKNPRSQEFFAFRMRGTASKLPRELLSWMDVNPREQKLSGPVINAITETWDSFPNEFHRCNRGILIFARDLEYDKD